MSARRIYASSSGDTWDLVQDGQQLFIKHTPNEASGGKASSRELAAFLTSNKGSAEYQALIALIGSLTQEEAVVASDADSATTI